MPADKESPASREGAGSPTHGVGIHFKKEAVKTNPDTTSQPAATSGIVHVHSLSTDEIAQERSVLLRTAVTEVSTRSSRHPVCTTILFDEGTT